MAPAPASLERSVTEHPLLSHPLSAAAARVFMEHHVFAVWDFMSLLKRLQRDLTCTTLPWRPPARPALARLVNEMVLGEESDDDGVGGHASHFETYLAAMREVGADTRPIETFLASVETGSTLEVALESSGAPLAARNFVRHTLRLALDETAPTAAVAAAFFHGREAIVPAMFRQLLVAIPNGAPRLRYYLARHVEVDEGTHGPMAESLVSALIESSGAAKAAAEAAAAALEARRALWDAVLAATVAVAA